MPWSRSVPEIREASMASRVLPSARPRSLFTSHSYMTSEIQDCSAPEVSHPGHFEPPDAAGADRSSWVQQLQQQRASGICLQPLWTLPPRKTPSVSYQTIQQQAAGESEQLLTPQQLQLPAAPMATSLGTITLGLLDCVRVDLSLNGAIRVINFRSNIVLAVSASGSSAALIHPNGRVHQYGSRVELCTSDPSGNNKYAKMWYKGVSFTADTCALVYLVDAAGLRSTTDTFPDLSRDFSLDVFYWEALYGVDKVSECLTAIDNIRYWVSEDGSEVWDVAGVRITQQVDGQIKLAVQRSTGRTLVKTSVALGTASVTTPTLHTTASLGHNPHMFVRRGERRLHYDATNFVVRNAGHSAGFDASGRLKVY